MSLIYSWLIWGLGLDTMQGLIFAGSAGDKRGIQLNFVEYACLHPCIRNRTMLKHTSSHCARNKEACHA